jgi:predicted O-linked N-acetylglucosamine transferase (SPINDLY family)
MSILARLRSAGRSSPPANIGAEASERRASQLIDEGNALEDQGLLEEALEHYEAAIRLAPHLARAHLNRGNVTLKKGDPEGAVAAYATALLQDPGYAAAHYNIGNAHGKCGRREAAVNSYRRAIELKPEFADAEVALACVLEDLGQLEAAVASYSRALEIRPDYAEVHCNLGNAFRTLGRFDAAMASYRRAVELKPDFVVAHSQLGAVLQKLGKFDDAVACYQRALELNAGFVDGYIGLGNALQEVGRRGEAEANYYSALEINPNCADAYCNLGNLLRDSGKPAEAIATYSRALEITPDFAEVHCNLANAFRDLGRLEDAVASYRRAVEIKSDFAGAHCNLGVTLKELGRLDEAAASFRSALSIDPKFLEARNNLGFVLQDFGQLDAAMTSYRLALEIKPDYAIAYCNVLFCLSHRDGVSPQALFAEHCGFEKQFGASLRASWPQHRNSRDPDRCLQIGLVSGDLRDHAVAYFVEPLLARLAGNPALSLHAYYNHAAEDRVTPRLRGYVYHWHPVAHFSDAELAQRIGDDGIDILIDLSGHTGENRLVTFARKPAPVQVSWIGYPGTTGLSAMDYYLTDRHFLPPGKFDDQFTEKLVYLPASAPFLPDEDAPPVNALPALSNGYVTFGSFNRPGKVSRLAVALWCKLLRALPDARLLLGGMPQDGRCGKLMEWFEEEGVTRERLSVHPRCGRAAYLGLHHQVDMCLDTLPYTGGTTTNHALWMGVPTLTLAGSTPPGRQGAAMLSHVGLEAFVAEDAEDFQRKGMAWAADLAALSVVRSGLRERFEQSAMTRPDVIATGLKRALRTMWRRWCAGLPAESFEVDLEDA